MTSTRVLDLALPAPDEEDEPGQETDRHYWESRSEASIMKLMDRLVDLISKNGTPVDAKYNKHYVGLQRDGMADNFVTFRPRRKHLIAEFRIDPSEELDARIDGAGLTQISYDKRWKRYRLQLKPADLSSNKVLLVELIRLARALPAEPLDSESIAIDDV